MKTVSKSKKRPVASVHLPSIHPGRILRKEVLEARGITQTQLATATGLPVSRINDLIKERRGITVDLWLNLQRADDLEEAQRTKAREYSCIELMAA